MCSITESVPLYEPVYRQITARDGSTLVLLHVAELLNIGYKHMGQINIKSDVIVHIQMFSRYYYKCSEMLVLLVPTVLQYLITNLTNNFTTKT